VSPKPKAAEDAWRFLSDAKFLARQIPRASQQRHKRRVRPSRMVIVCVMSVPHISLTVSVMIVPSCGLVLGASNAMRRE